MVTDEAGMRWSPEGTATWQVHDLSQPLGPQTAAWPGWPGVSAQVVCEIERDGMYDRTLSLPEHSGTHLDAPAHFDPRGRFVHQLTVSQLVAPCVVIDVRSACGDDPDFAVQADHVASFEAEHGPIPGGSAVLVCTGWDRHLTRPEAYIGGSGSARCPGLSADAMRSLVQRKIVGVGIDTLSIDPGNSSQLPAHKAGLSAGLWHLEGLTGLDRLPAVGSWIVVGVIPLVDGSGAPARVFGMVPPG